MYVNENIKPRELTEQEKADREKGIYDSFANYLVFCPKCGKMAKTNVYIMRAEGYAQELKDAGQKCSCGNGGWAVGYPANSKTGFVKFK